MIQRPWIPLCGYYLDSLQLQIDSLESLPDPLVLLDSLDLLHQTVEVISLTQNRLLEDAIQAKIDSVSAGRSILELMSRTQHLANRLFADLRKFERYDDGIEAQYPVESSVALMKPLTSDRLRNRCQDYLDRLVAMVDSHQSSWPRIVTQPNPE